MVLNSKNYQSEQDLPTKEANDNFWIVRIVKFVVLGLIVLVLVWITIAFLVEFTRNEIFRSDIWKILVPQLGTIVVSAFAIIGLGKFIK